MQRVERERELKSRLNSKCHAYGWSRDHGTPVVCMYLPLILAHIACVAR